MFLNLQKNKSQKLSMLEWKQGQFWNVHWIPHNVMKPDFQFFEPIFFLFQVKVFLEKKYISVGRSLIIRKIRRKLEFGFIIRLQNLSLIVFVLSLIVFDFYSFEISKINNQINLKILIYSKTISKINELSGTKSIYFLNFT